MQTGYISFCNSTAFNIKSENIKKDILNKIETLTGIKIIQKHFNNFYESHFKKLNDVPHLISLKSNGNPYLLFLTRINFINISIFIDKKIQPGYFLPRMIITYFQFDDKLYNNTLFDGEMVKIKNNKWNFIINDIFINKNNNLSNQTILNRLDIIYNIFKNDVNFTQYDICVFSINKYFKYGDMKYMVEEYKQKLNYTCRGIYFNPLYFKFKKILYNFDNSLINSVKRIKYQNNEDFLISKSNRKTENISSLIDKSSSDINNKNKILKVPDLIKISNTKPIINNKEKNDKTKEFYIEQTDMPDVFYLYDINRNTTVITAYIPDIITSHYLKDIFKEVTIITKLKIKCKLINKNNKEKWCPFELC